MVIVAVVAGHEHDDAPANVLVALGEHVQVTTLELMVEVNVTVGRVSVESDEDASVACLLILGFAVTVQVVIVVVEDLSRC